MCRRWAREILRSVWGLQRQRWELRGPWELVGRLLVTQKAHNVPVKGAAECVGTHMLKLHQNRKQSRHVLMTGVAMKAVTGEVAGVPMVPSSFMCTPRVTNMASRSLYRRVNTCTWLRGEHHQSTV